MVVTGQTAPRLSANVKTENHLITSGVEAKLGGGDQGMNPHELLQASLVACTIITLQMYVERKKWVVGPIDVAVTIVSEGKEASMLKREIKFSGSETEVQRQRLLEIANMCPIHRMLESKISIETVLKV